MTRLFDPFTIARYVQMAEDVKKPNAILLDVMTPLGKRLGDCTGVEIGQLGEHCIALGKFLDRINP